VQSLVVVAVEASGVLVLLLHLELVAWEVSVAVAAVALRAQQLELVAQAVKAQSCCIGRSKCYLRKNLVLFQQT